MIVLLLCFFYTHCNFDPWIVSIWCKTLSVLSFVFCFILQLTSVPVCQSLLCAVFLLKKIKNLTCTNSIMFCIATNQKL